MDWQLQVIIAPLPNFVSFNKVESEETAWFCILLKNRVASLYLLNILNILFCILAIHCQNESGGRGKANTI